MRRRGRCTRRWWVGLPPNHWRWDQINFGFNETGLEPPPQIEEEKSEVEGQEAVGKRSTDAGSERIENSKEWLARYH